jgi:hypothetical protein
MDNISTVEWSDRREAVESLKNAARDWRYRITRTRQSELDICRIVEESVASNTFRAFRRVEKPSRLYRGWAYMFLKNGFHRLIGKENREDFDKAHEEIVHDLLAYWACVGDTEMQHYGQAAKLVNLTVRHGCESSLVNDDEFERAVKLIHVPLDVCVLRAIRKCVKDFDGYEKIGTISKRPSMSSVSKIEQYQAIQNGIRSLADEAEVTPIVVDEVAWVQPHARLSQAAAAQE